MSQILTEAQWNEMRKLQRLPKQSLSSYVQDVIKCWIILRDYQVKYRNFFLEELYKYVKSLPENEVNLSLVIDYRRYESQYLNRVLKNNKETIEFIKNEITQKFYKLYRRPFNNRNIRAFDLDLIIDSPLFLSNLGLTDTLLGKYMNQIHDEIIKTFPIPDFLIQLMKENGKLEEDIVEHNYIKTQLLFTNNKLTKIPDLGYFDNLTKTHIHLLVDLEGNTIPVKDFLKTEPLYGDNIVFRFQGNEGFSFKKFDSKHLSEYKASDGKLYKVYTIPKGTLLFRQYHSMEDIHYSFIGYPASRGNDYPKDKYYLLKDHRSYFTLEPRFKDGHYGPVDVVMILQQDVKLIIGWFGEDAYSKEACPENLPTEVGAGTCMVQEFRDNGFIGWMAEPFSSDEGGPAVRLSMIPYLEYMPHFTSQVMIHPTKHNEDITIDISTVDTPEKMETYLKENMERFNYKPLKIFDEKSTEEEYLKFIKDLLSKKGWKDEDDNKVYKAIRNPIDGTYILK